MRAERINREELKLLARLVDGPSTVKQLARATDRSVSWTSERATRLEVLGLAKKERFGNSVKVSLSEGQVGEDLRLLFTEDAYVDLAKVLAGPGLPMLLWLLPPGSTVDELEERTRLSTRTIRAKLRQWQGMGLAVGAGTPARYVLGRTWEHLGRLLVDYSEERSARRLRSLYPDAAIVWRWRDEILFSVGRRLADEGVHSAGLTRLEQLGYDVRHSREYYLMREGAGGVGEEEALVQALVTDPGNPRGRLYIRQALMERRVDRKLLARQAERYGIKGAVMGLVGTDGG